MVVIDAPGEGSFRRALSFSITSERSASIPWRPRRRSSFVLGPQLSPARTPGAGQACPLAQVEVRLGLCQPGSRRRIRIIVVGRCALPRDSTCVTPDPALTTRRACADEGGAYWGSGRIGHHWPLTTSLRCRGVGRCCGDWRRTCRRAGVAPLFPCRKSPHRRADWCRSRDATACRPQAQATGRAARGSRH